MACQVEIPKNSASEEQRLTVGKEFFLNCKLDAPAQLDLKTAHFKLPAEMKYSLKILGINSATGNQLQLKVTSYSAAHVQIPDLHLIDDKHQEVSLGPIEFQVQSLLQELQQKAGPDKKIEPYGPFGPMKTPWPLWSWSIAALLLMVFLMSAIRKYYLSSQKKRFIERTPYLKSLDPLVEYEKNVRKLTQDYAATDEKTAAALQANVDLLDRFWRIYWTRCFHFPALYWSEKKLLKDFAKNYPALYRGLEKEIRSFIFEMRKLRKKQIQTNEKDFQKLIKTNRNIIEKVDQLKVKILGKQR